MTGQRLTNRIRGHRLAQKLPRLAPRGTGWRHTAPTGAGRAPTGAKRNGGWHKSGGFVPAPGGFGAWPGPSGPLYIIKQHMGAPIWFPPGEGAGTNLGICAGSGAPGHHSSPPWHHSVSMPPSNQRTRVGKHTIMKKNTTLDNRERIRCRSYCAVYVTPSQVVTK